MSSARWFTILVKFSVNTFQYLTCVESLGLFSFISQAFFVNFFFFFFYSSRFFFLERAWLVRIKESAVRTIVHGVGAHRGGEFEMRPEK